MNCMRPFVILVLLAVAVAEPALADSTVDDYLDVVPQFHIVPGNMGTSVWKYTTSQPSASWNQPGYDDAFWAEGQAGFGSGNGQPGDAMNTAWSGSTIWLRRWVNLTSEQIDDLALYGRHDDTIEIFINGVPAYDRNTWSSRYRFLGAASGARTTLQPGLNLIAVYCFDYGGDRYVDLGVTANPLLDMPVSGSATTPAVEEFRNVVHQFMIDNVIPAGGLAVMKGDGVVATHGFGWMERTLDTPVPDDPILRLASNDKVVTAGAVRQAIATGLLDHTGTPIHSNTAVFPILVHYGIAPPPGYTPDPLINTVTIEHLLDHQGGVVEVPWIWDLYNAYGVPPGTTGPEHNAGWIYGSSLNFPPGSQTQYSSAGYFLLRYLVHLLYGDFESLLYDVVLPPTGGEDILVSKERANDRHPREPWYATNEESYDRWVYLDHYFALGASPESMVRYLRRYHMTEGTILEWPTGGYGLFYGAMAGTWSVTIQRRYDEVNIALIFDQVAVYDAISNELNAVANGIPPDQWGEDPTAIPDAGVAPVGERQLSVLPNPLQPGARIRFDVDHEQAVRMRVIDIGGRQVADLGRRSYPAGVHSVRWDGYASSGEKIASGTYFIELLGNSWRTVARFTVLK